MTLPARGTQSQGLARSDGISESRWLQSRPKKGAVREMSQFLKSPRRVIANPTRVVVHGLPPDFDPPHLSLLVRQL